MTDEEYKGIYNVLSGLKEDLNEVKLKYSYTVNKLDSLSKEITKLGTDHERLRNALYEGHYGKDSLVEEIQRCRNKIADLEGKLITAKKEIGALEDRWIKFLWASSISVFLIIISALINEVFIQGQLPDQLRPVVEFLGKIDL